MQLKLNRRFNIIAISLIIIELIAIVYLFLNAATWQDHRILVIVVFVIVTTLLLMGFKYYELNADKNMINKMVANGDIALAEIKKGTIERVIKDSSNRKYPVWNLEIDLYDRDLNKHSMTMLDKFNVEQTNIPHGFIYVTYDPNSPEKMFVIPNLLLQIYDGAEDMINKYEKNIKNVKYLNVYYQRGIVMETFKKSLNKAKEYDELDKGE